MKDWLKKKKQKTKKKTKKKKNRDDVPLNRVDLIESYPNFEYIKLERIR